MTRLAVKAVALLVVAGMVSCGGGDTSPTPTPVATATNVAITREQAIEYATEVAASQFGDNPVEVTAEHMNVEQADTIVHGMGLGELPVRSFTPEPCPSPGTSCGGFPGIVAGTPGYLVLVTGVPSERFLPLTTPARRAVLATWISDKGGLVGAPFAYPTPTTQPDGQHVLIERTDWQLTAPPSGDRLNLQVAVGDSCRSFDRFAMSEDDNTVTIHAYIRASFGKDQVCLEYMQLEDFAVRLYAPLGNRELVGCDGYQIGVFDASQNEIDCRRLDTY